MSGLKHDILRLIRRGEPVIESVPNRVFEELDDNIRYVWDAVQAASAGSTVFAREVTVDAAVVPGMAVFFNPATVRFEGGLAVTATDLSTGILQTSPRAGIWGVVFTKASATLADLLLSGYAPLDLSLASADTGAGTYYLSSQTPGRLVKDRPPVAVPVLRADGQGNVSVNPQFVDFLDRHVHYHFGLTAFPAGDTTPPAPGDRHVITSPDPALPGWLPAAHAGFAGLAPAGAAFGYNLAAHPALKRAWPPLPPEGAFLNWDKGLTKDVAGTAVPLGAAGLCVIDRNGIWWLSDCYQDVPWPADLDTSSPSSYSDSSDVECPRHLQMALDLWFTRPTFSNGGALVTSLRSSDSRLRLVCTGTSLPAVSGDLEISLDLTLAVSAGLERGGIALKTLTGGNQFTRGWLQEGLYALSDNVILTGEHQAPLDPDLPLGTQLHQGKVGLAVVPESTLELATELFRLDGVEEDFLFGNTFLTFHPGQLSSVRAKMEVPAHLSLVAPQLALRFRLLGRSLGTLPVLTVTARRVPRNDPAATPLALPTNLDEFNVVLTTTLALAASNQYVEVTAAAFAVVAGDLIFFSLSRGATDGYSADVGLLQATGILTSGA